MKLGYAIMKSDKSKSVGQAGSQRLGKSYCCSLRIKAVCWQISLMLMGDLSCAIQAFNLNWRGPPTSWRTI